MIPSILPNIVIIIKIASYKIFVRRNGSSKKNNWMSVNMMINPRLSFKPSNHPFDLLFLPSRIPAINSDKKGINNFRMVKNVPVQD